MATVLNLKKFILFLLLCFSLHQASGQITNPPDSCHNLEDSLENTLDDSSYYFISSDIDNICGWLSYQDSIAQSQKNKELLQTRRKRIAVISSLVVLQATFGFDPKFTLINLVWLFL